jgi:hypothetical protein
MTRKPNPTDQLRQAVASKASLRREFAGVAPTTSLPVSWNGEESSRDAQVSAPSTLDLQAYRDGTAKVCGNCRHFDLESGRQKMIQERFPERLVREQEWKLRHLGAKLDELGLCGDSGGTMVTGFMAKACDHYTENKK